MIDQDLPNHADQRGIGAVAKKSSRMNFVPQTVGAGNGLAGGAMLMDLLKALPETRGSALREELELLDWSLEQMQFEPRDLAVASTSGSSGAGRIAARV